MNLNVDEVAFENLFKQSMPASLRDFYRKISSHEPPCTFKCSSRGFILEVQYYVSLEDTKAEDVDHLRVVFAINSDGNEQLFDLTKKALPVLQRERDALDYIGLAVGDLLAASVV